MELKKVLYFIVIVAVLSGLNRFISENNASKMIEANPDVEVFVSEQSAEGVTQARFDQDFLKNLENWMVERVKKNGEKISGSKLLDIKTESVYFVYGGIKLAVVRLFTSVDYSVLIMGVVGDQIKRVTCLRKSPDPIVITQGACGEKISEVFNVKIGGSR